MKASGNAFNVLALACMLAPLLESAAKMGVVGRDQMKRLSKEDILALWPVNHLPCRPKSKHEEKDSACTAAKRRRVAM